MTRMASSDPARHPVAGPEPLRRQACGTTVEEATTHACERCGMPIETGRWCTYCTIDSGELQPFEERFARMVAWQERRHPEQSRGEAEAATLAYLATMPAWRDHPRVLGRG